MKADDVCSLDLSLLMWMLPLCRHLKIVLLPRGKFLEWLEIKENFLKESNIFLVNYIVEES